MDLNTHVKSVVETMTCPFHGEHPKVIHEDAYVDVICCCSDFRLSCLKKIVDTLTLHLGVKKLLPWLLNKKKNNLKNYWLMEEIITVEANLKALRLDLKNLQGKRKKLNVRDN